MLKVPHQRCPSGCSCAMLWCQPPLVGGSLGLALKSVPPVAPQLNLSTTWPQLPATLLCLPSALFAHALACHSFGS